ncbi:MAG: dihydrolipoyl dehydrogenase [Candidatus Marinimicrobia bacterium]|nr:dihydrolipoyl dehydrogenase [Candidatus Neomarinimicrobiota bacterium]
MSKNIKAEIAVLGAGPGGYAAAFRAADLGKQVVLVDKDASLGGVCLNRGCIPSKALLHVARVLEESQEVADFGITFGKPKLDVDKIREWKNGIVSRLTRGIGQMAKARKVQVVQGVGKFTSSTEMAVETDDGTVKIEFENAIIASGSRPATIPSFPVDDKRLLNSTGALDLADVPKRLLVIGAGYIGLEMGTVYQALGSKVSVVEFMENLLPGADADLVRPLAKRLKARFENIWLKTKVSKIEPQKNGLKVHFEGEKKVEPQVFDKVLVAVGRKPNSENLGLENTHVNVTDRGFIEVNEYQRTADEHILAIGDVAGDPMLAHKATYEAKVAAEVIAGLPAKFDARAIPAVIFTDPEIAWAGLTETEAKAKDIPYEKSQFPWAASGRALALGREDGFTKMLFDPETHRVLGIGIVGPNAGDLISEGALAIEMGADAEDIGLTIHPHPTLSETVMNAAEVFTGTVTDIYVPKKKK